MSEFLEQFLIECRELIAQATDDLLTLEHDPANAGRLDSLFRAVHTLKGAAGIMDFDAMARLTHAAEDALSAVRKGERAMTPALVTDCLSCLDRITAWLADWEAQGAPPEAPAAEADRLIVAFAPEAAAPPDEPGISAAAAAILHEQIELLCLPADDGSAGRIASALAVIRHILQCANLPLAQPGPPAAETANEAEPARPRRLDDARIDGLMRLAGELVVLKNEFGHHAERLDPAQHRGLLGLHARLDRLSGDLLHAVVTARVQPLRQVFQRFPRLVREIAAGLNKRVRLLIEGDDTEADRRIVEALFEPLLHVLRNAVDHGIEPVAQREALGKPVPALIRLTAARIDDEVVIEIADDGRGIDTAAIRAAAEARGIAAAGQLAAMSEDELRALIFAPGFSTAGQVSSLSGRGVGMDAVRSAIQALNGKVSVQSETGAGTVFRFHLPFTVLLTSVLTVEAGGQLLGIPFEAVVETLKISAASRLRLGATEAIAWRGRTLPLLSLQEALHLPDSAPGPDLQVIIVRHGDTALALKVDGLGKPVEVMLKPLDGLLAGMRGVAGTALLGDGRVLIVLELADLLE